MMETMTGYRINVLEEFVEVFFVKEDFVPVITVFIELFPAFSDCDVIIISAGSSYIKKISSTLTGSDAFAINALHSFVVVFVRHC